MQNQPGLSITQAASATGLSPKTIRRYVKDGKLPFTMIPGKYGYDEYRITEIPPDMLADDAMPKALPWGMDIIARLEIENRDLAGRLGAAQERIRALDAQVKLLTMPPWWRRILLRRTS